MATYTITSIQLLVITLATISNCVFSLCAKYFNYIMSLRSDNKIMKQKLPIYFTDSSIEAKAL